MKKILLTVLTLFLGLTLYGQFPNSGNRMLLGRQTTAKYLVWMGSIGDTATIEPSSMNEAWIMIDTATNYIYGYRQKAWRLLYANAIMPFDSITFNTAKDGTVGVGEVEYRDTYGSLIQGLKGGTVTNVIGQQIHQRVTNTTGGTLTKGTAVFLYGHQGNRITVRKALATADSTSANTFGIVAENITNGQSGYVITEGLLTNMNTNALTEGEAVYLSPTVAGQLTSTEPQAPQHTVYIGVCVKQNTGSGELFVKIRNGLEINELHDVLITSPTSNASLYYNTAQRVWRDTGAVLLVTDTASMLTNYINVVDTSSMLLPYLRKSQMRGTAGYIAKYATDSTLTNSIIRESGTKIGINSAAGTNYTATLYNDDSGGAPGGTAGAITITLASSKTNNKGINITATSGGGDNYTGVDATVSNGTISNIGVKGTATFGAVAVGGLFSASNASTNYGIQINSGMSSDTATYAIHSASNAKVYFNGNVGIRTPAPDSALTVNGTGNFTSNVRVGGNLGVNTATPGSRLTVIGTASLGNGAANSTGSGYNATVTSGGAKATTANNTLLALLSNDALASNPLGLFMDLSNNSTATSRHARLQVGEYGTGNYRSLILQPDGGLVGIRNSSPDSVLTITGGIRTSTSINTGSDATINGLRVGRGAGNSNLNTTVGRDALFSNTTGTLNTAIGIFSLLTNTTGVSNTGLGYNSLFFNLSGNSNTGLGNGALYTNSTGSNNVAVGNYALYLPAGASFNVAVGVEALENDSTGSSNVAVGSFALTSNKTGNENTGVGHASLSLNTTGLNNSALGTNSARGNTTGGSNTAIGSYSLYTNSTGSNNVAIGPAALFANTAGNNTGVGVSSLTANTTGAANTALGFQAMLSNTTAGANTGLGAYSLLSNTTGTANTSVGHAALYSNTTSGNNTAVGFYTMYATTGANNTAIGSESLRFNTTGAYNTAVGHQSLILNTTGAENTAVGQAALAANTTGFHNSSIGRFSMLANTTGQENSALGHFALAVNTTGIQNTSMGASSLRFNTTGSGNSAFGYLSLFSNTTASNNTAFGYLSLYSNTTGSNNTALGLEAGRYVTAGTANQTSTNSLYLGYDSRASASGNTNETVIGYLARGNGSNTTTIGNTSTTKTILWGDVGIGVSPSSKLHTQYSTGGTSEVSFYRAVDISTGLTLEFKGDGTATRRINMYADANGGAYGKVAAFNNSIYELFTPVYLSTNLKLDYTAAFDANTIFQMPNTSTKGAKGFVWATYSDARIKDNFDTIQNAIQIINRLRPLHYNQYDSEVMDGEIVTGDTNIRTVGFVAQEVVDVIPQAVQVGNQTQLWGMDYTKIIPFLTKAIQEQQIQIEDLKKQIQEIKSQINK